MNPGKRWPNIFTHDRLTWHGEVFERRGTEPGWERAHPVGVDIADSRRSGLHVRNGLSTIPPPPHPQERLSGADAIPVTDTRALHAPSE